MTIPRSEIALSLLATLALLSACSNDTASENTAPTDASATSGVAEAAPDAVPSSAFPTTALIDPNTASQEVLAAVAGISEDAVAAIIAARPFSTPSEMDAAIGETLDEDARKAVYALVFVKVGLNSGADEDYRLIPSTMPAGKLAHEFEEYRPYDSMEEFQREMVKYVSNDEVAYLTRFVTLD